MGDIHTNKNDPNDLAVCVFERLILGDIALAEQQRQTTIDLAFSDGRIGRAGSVQNGTHCPIAVLFAQGGGDTDKIITAAHKQGRDCPCTRQEVVRKCIVFMQARFTPFQKGNAKPVNGLELTAVDAQRLR